MNRLFEMLILGLAVAALTGCEPKTDAPAEGGTAGSPGAAEVVVTTEIPEELTAEAEKSITADNVEAAMAELEREIDADEQ